MDVTVVGSGTLLPSDGHRSPGHLVEWTRGSLLLDCGSGVLHGLARDGADWAGITHVALSHFHTDHTGDLAPLLWAWKHGVPAEGRTPRTLLGPPGTARFLERLAAAHGDFVLDPGLPLEVVEVDRDGVWEDGKRALRLRTHPARHTPEAVAFRVETEEGRMGYTGDTGPRRSLHTFFRGVELLVAECAVPDDAPADNHLTPRTVAELAVGADPGILVLTHLYPAVDRRTLPDLIRARGYTGVIHTGRDGLRLRIGGDGAGASV